MEAVLAAVKKPRPPKRQRVTLTAQARGAGRAGSQARHRVTLRTHTAQRGRRTWVMTLGGTMAVVARIGLGGSALYSYGVHFQWNANPEPEVIGYRLYWTRVSGDYSALQAVTLGAITDYRYYIERPAGLGWWYFALTARTANTESAPSDEASIEITAAL